MPAPLERHFVSVQRSAPMPAGISQAWALPPAPVEGMPSPAAVAAVPPPSCHLEEEVHFIWMIVFKAPQTLLGRFFLDGPPWYGLARIDA
jgi:hypothetical protein